MTTIAPRASPVNIQMENVTPCAGDPSAARGKGKRGPAAPASDSLPPLVSCPYGHNPHKQRASGRVIHADSLAAPVFRPTSLKIHPDGFEWRPESLSTGEQPEQLKDAFRGEIKGFSAKASGRLRQWLVENWSAAPSCRNPFAVTLTARTAFSPSEWRSVVKRFRQTLSRKCPAWAWCWRVELQRRGTPHLHCILWAPAIEARMLYPQIRGWWLQATRETGDQASRQHAVKLRDIDGGQGSGWMVYCAMHNSKANGAQLGWIGKQWGLWNVSAWAPRPASAVVVGPPAPARLAFVRRLRRWSRGRTGRAKPLAPPWRVQAHHTIRRCIPEAAVVQLLRGLDLDNQKKL